LLFAVVRGKVSPASVGSATSTVVGPGGSPDGASKGVRFLSLQEAGPVNQERVLMQCGNKKAPFLVFSSLPYNKAVRLVGKKKKKRTLLFVRSQICS
jgi:hypothetical protein